MRGATVHFSPPSSLQGYFVFSAHFLHFKDRFFPMSTSKKRTRPSIIDSDDEIGTNPQSDTGGHHAQSDSDAEDLDTTSNQQSKKPRTTLQATNTRSQRYSVPSRKQKQISMYSNAQVLLMKSDFLRRQRESTTSDQ